MGEAALQLPVIDLSSEDRISSANSIRQACLDLGFFYLVNHGVEEELCKKVFEHSKKFFSLPVKEKLKFAVKNHRGYTAMYDEKLDTTLNSKGDSKESFYIGSLSEDHLNQWPFEEDMPSWRSTMEAYYNNMLLVDAVSPPSWENSLLPGKIVAERHQQVSPFFSFWSAATELVSLIALALNLDEDFFINLGALKEPMAFVRLLHYPGNVDSSSDEIEIYGASAHSDFGMITLLLTDGVPGLQVCRDKFKQPQVWEDVPSLSGAFIVNIGDLMERWTNCLFRSTMHRVMLTGEERYSVAFFLDGGKDCMVECIESCRSESCPPRFPPIRTSDYIEERILLAAMASADGHRISI